MFLKATFDHKRSTNDQQLFQAKEQWLYCWWIRTTIGVLSHAAPAASVVKSTLVGDRILRN